MQRRIASLLAVTLTLLGQPPALAGQLVDSGAAFPAAGLAATAFGDYDLDGDLDLLLAGFVGPTDFTGIFRNDGPSGWTDIGAGLAPVRRGAAAWGDYDGDEDLDLLLAGGSGGGRVSRIYRNDGGAFTDSGAALRGVEQSAAAWADIDLDGDLDLALHGSGAGGAVTRIYRNDAGQFVEIDPPIPDLTRGSLDFGDADGDGDHDLVVTGVIESTITHSDVYRNDGGQFLAVHAGLKNLFDGAARWGDYDLDRDLDVLENGSDSTSVAVFTRLYRNDGDLAFSVQAPIEGAGEGAALGWGDYDTDGDPDFAAMAVGFNRTEVFRNDGGGAFSDAGESLAGGCCGSLSWGDVDADGDLDLVVAGLSSGVKLYRNVEAVPNTPPTPPVGLVAAVGPGSVDLSWSAATDATVAPGLTYNVRVGTSPGGSEVMPAMANPETGLRRIPAPGNASQELSWRLIGLPPATYFWSVQAIDPGFEGSTFAPEQSFVVGNTTAVGDGDGGDGLGNAVPDFLDRHLPQLVVERGGGGVAVLRYSVPGGGRFTVSVLDAAGRRVRTLLHGSGPVEREAFHWSPSDLASGVYFLRLAGFDGRSASCRFVWTK